MLNKVIRFNDLPDNYKNIMAQALLFTHPLDTYYELLIVGGIPLDFTSWMSIEGFIPSKLKDIDFVIGGYIDGIMKEMDAKLCEYYSISKCLYKLGNYDGTVPPTSYFVFNKKTCMEILNGEKFNGLPNFIKFLINFVIELDDNVFEHIDVIPFINGNNVPCDSINEDAIRRDFTINSLYMKLSVENDVININIIDPLLGIKDLMEFTLRTPIIPLTTFKQDPRRLTRIVKMVEKMLRLFGKCNIHNDITNFMENDMEEIVSILLKEYPRREPLHFDTLSMLKSNYFEQIMRNILTYPSMFKLICGINPMVQINTVPIDDMIIIYNKLLGLNLSVYESNVLILVITGYRLVNELNDSVFTTPSKKYGILLLDKNNCSLYTYVLMWLPMLDKHILATIKLLNFIGFYQVGTYDWYRSIGEFIIFYHKTVGTCYDAYEFVSKIIKIVQCFVDNNIILGDYDIRYENIYENYKKQINDICNSKDANKHIKIIKKNMIDMVTQMLII
jgi:hypothetical protein